MTINVRAIAKLISAHSTISVAVAAVVIISGGLTGWLREHDAKVRALAVLGDSIAAVTTQLKANDAARKVSDSARTQSAAKAARLDSLLRIDSASLTSVLVKYHATLAKLPSVLVTHADSQQVLASWTLFKFQAHQADSACTEYMQSCSAFRAQAAKTFKDDSDAVRNRDSTIALLHAQLRLSSKVIVLKAPSRWAPIWKWTKRAGLACGAVSLWNHRPCWQP